MIHFALSCEKKHEFEGWFRDSEDYENQAKRGLLACPICNSVQIEKALMSPAVSTSKGKGAKRTSNPLENSGKATLSDDSYQDKDMEKMQKVMKKLKKKITENADNVGTRFAEEARKMHYGEKKKKGIYGKATLEEAKMLNKEGINFFPMPKLPEDQN